ncbi:unnamed protein product [Arctia plantaginis]|uniref:SCP domain-containing protein n=1 Tax=Arctia plantaginis TaxID=874455 RepID=A0A8S0ZU70_ARCPL|nr:unnamed protein product [Arctia plantaginis]
MWKLSLHSRSSPIKTMKSNCLYLTLLISATCILEISGSTKEIHAFVDGHNSRRLRVAKGEVKGQPGASEMKTMMWDHELYVKASTYAAKLPRQHNPDKSVPSGRFRTGENLFWYSTTNHNYQLSPETAVEAWFREHHNYTYGPIRRSDFDGSKSYQIGHYTQMVWSNTIYVGCAISETYKGQWKKFFVVCNYGPSGNYIGQEPYKKGGPSNKLTCGCPKNDRSCDCNKLYG